MSTAYLSAQHEAGLLCSWQGLMVIIEHPHRQADLCV